MNQSLGYQKQHSASTDRYNLSTYSKWILPTTLANSTMLEKITGKPMLHKLRVIHILEADYNLALKLIVGKRLLQNCEKHDALGN
jgi:hypothetical protein